MVEIPRLQDLLALSILALGNPLLFSKLHQSPLIGYLATGIVAPGALSGPGAFFFFCQSPLRAQ